MTRTIKHARTSSLKSEVLEAKTVQQSSVHVDDRAPNRTDQHAVDSDDDDSELELFAEELDIE